MTAASGPARDAELRAEDRMDPRVWRVAAVVFLGPLMTQIDSTVVNFSLATIREQLHSSIETVQWIISGYLLALALMLPLNAWLVGRVGVKRLYVGCFAAFTVASLLCGTATSVKGLIWARVLQGVGGGLLAPMAQLMLARVAGRQLARVMGFTAMPVLLAPMLGPVVAGWILKYASWRWLFYINLPVGVAAVTLAALLLPRDAAAGERRPFDLTGFLLVSPGLALFLYGLDHGSERSGQAALVAGLGLLAGFIWHAARRKGAALIDLDLFKVRRFATAVATQFISNGVGYAGQLLVPLYLLAGCGLSAPRAGWLLVPMGVGMMCVYPAMGYLTDRWGCRGVSVGGALLALVGTLPFLWMIEHQLSPALLMLSLLARGAGQGAVGVPTVSAAYASVPRRQLALATTATNIVQRLGGPIATTIMAVVISLSAPRGGGAGARPFLTPFLALIGLQLMLLVATSRLPRWTHPTPAESA